MVERWRGWVEADRILGLAGVEVAHLVDAGASYDSAILMNQGLNPGSRSLSLSD